MIERNNHHLNKELHINTLKNLEKKKKELNIKIKTIDHENNRNNCEYESLKDQAEQAIDDFNKKLETYKNVNTECYIFYQKLKIFLMDKMIFLKKERFS